MPWTTGFSNCLPQHVPSSQRSPRTPQCVKVPKFRVKSEQRTSVQAVTERGNLGVYLQVCNEPVLRDEVRVVEGLNERAALGMCRSHLGSIVEKGLLVAT